MLQSHSASGETRMLSRIALLLMGLLLAGRAIADDNFKSLPPAELCRQSTAYGRTVWLQDLFDAPPAVAKLMVDVIDGKLPQVRQQLAMMNAAEAARWRQSALVTASFAGQSTLAEGLLDDAAAVDDKGWAPGYKPELFDHIVEGMKHDPRFGGPKAVEGMKASGLMDNQGQEMGPALIIATQCDNSTLVDVLLRHHADAKVRVRPDGIDVLGLAIINGNATIVQSLLDHGVDVCADDQLSQQNRLEQKKKHPEYELRPFVTYAGLGRRTKLPANIIARLTCPAFDSTH
jgi:hypothetical protein